MEKKELYNSAHSKIQKIYELLFDENGDLKPDFYLTDEEIEAFRSYDDQLYADRKQQLETLLGGIIYNKYTFKYETIIKNMYELSYQIHSLCKIKNSAYNSNQIYARQAHLWNGNVLFSSDKDCQSVQISLYNLNGIYEYRINLGKGNDASKLEGKVTIVRNQVKEVSLSGAPIYQDGEVELYDLGKISSKEPIGVLMIAEKELLQILHNLTMEANQREEKPSDFRKK